MTTRVNTRALFYDIISKEDREKYKPKYTIQECDIVKGGVTYKSLYKLYLESVDEFDFANTHLGGMATWEQLKDAKWFLNGYRAHRGLAAWEEDMRARDESTAKKALLLAVSEGSVTAANTLFNSSKKKAETKRGRYVKDEAKKEAKQLAEDKDFWNETASRLDNVINILD
jgi:hypothetical protein